MFCKLPSFVYIYSRTLALVHETMCLIWAQAPSVPYYLIFIILLLACSGSICIYACHRTQALSLAQFNGSYLIG